MLRRIKFLVHKQEAIVAGLISMIALPESYVSFCVSSVWM